MHAGINSAEALNSIALSPAPKYLSNQEVMSRLGVCDQTLRNWRNQGIGPRYTRFGTRIRYRLDDVLEFEKAKTFESRGDERASLATAA